jgi:hypothetical protein
MVVTQDLLKERLQALERNLNGARDLASWQTGLMGNDFSAPGVGWNAAIGEIRKRAQAQIGEISSIKKDLERKDQTPEQIQETLTRAWQLLSRLTPNSQDIFCECLEVLGGLAIRLHLGNGTPDSGSDPIVWAMADELIANLAEQARLEPSLTVPASREAHTKTLARLIRLPFPEWNMWSVPLAAHEYGRVVVFELRQQPDQEDLPRLTTLNRLLRTQTASLVERDERMQRVLADPNAPEDEKQRVRDVVEEQVDDALLVLAADGFATYAVGPAYACTMLLLRFNPAAAYASTSGPPAALRAQLLLQMLRQMNDGVRVPGATGMGDVITQLAQLWSDLLNEAKPAGSLDAAHTEVIEPLVSALWEAFEEQFLPGAGYPINSSLEGWKVSRTWYESWLEFLAPGDDRPFQKPSVSASNKLRDVVNAAWLCRLYAPARLRSIYTAATEVWRAIADERQAAEDRKRRGPPLPPTS